MSFVGSRGSFLGDPIAQVEWGCWIALCSEEMHISVQEGTCFGVPPRCGSAHSLGPSPKTDFPIKVTY